MQQQQQITNFAPELDACPAHTCPTCSRAATGSEHSIYFFQSIYHHLISISLCASCPSLPTRMKAPKRQGFLSALLTTVSPAPRRVPRIWQAFIKYLLNQWIHCSVECNMQSMLHSASSLTHPVKGPTKILNPRCMTPVSIWIWTGRFRTLQEWSSFRSFQVHYPRKDLGEAGSENPSN